MLLIISSLSKALNIPVDRRGHIDILDVVPLFDNGVTKKLVLQLKPFDRTWANPDLLNVIHNDVS